MPHELSRAPVATREKPRTPVGADADVAPGDQRGRDAEGGMPPVGVGERDDRCDAQHEKHGGHGLGTSAPLDQGSVKREQMFSYPASLGDADEDQYALLFPGESVAPPGTLSVASSKDSVWALYIRTLLLWHSSLRMRSDARMSNADRAQYSINVWLEIDNIEDTLDRHSCSIETGFLAQVREILFK